MLSQAQFEQAIKTQGPSLLTWLEFLCRGNRPEAEDLLQKTFVDVWRARAQYDGRPLAPWLRGFARNRLLVERRANLRRLRLHTQVEAESIHLPATLEEAPSAPALRGCLEKLPPLDRHILCLAYGLDDSESLHPLTDAAVASRLSTPDTPWRPERVKTRRHRALSALRSCLELAGQYTCFPEAPSEAPMATPRAERHPSLQTLLECLEPDPAGHPLPSGISASLRHLHGCSSCQHQLDAAQQLELTLLEQGWKRNAHPETPPPLPATLERTLLNIPAEETRRVTYSHVIQGSPANRGFPGTWPLLLTTAAAGLLVTLLQKPAIDPASTPDVQARGPLEAPALPPVEVVIQRPNTPDAERVPLLPHGPQHWRAQVPRTSLLQLFLSAQGPEHSDTVTVECALPGRGTLPLDRQGTLRWTGAVRTTDTPIGDPLSLSALGLGSGEVLVCTLQHAPGAGLPPTRLQLELEGVP